jgi:hypothetical protein
MTGLFLSRSHAVPHRDRAIMGFAHNFKQEILVGAIGDH